MVGKPTCSVILDTAPKASTGVTAMFVEMLKPWKEIAVLPLLTKKPPSTSVPGARGESWKMLRKCARHVGRGTNLWEWSQAS